MKGPCEFPNGEWPKCPPNGPRGGIKHGHLWRTALKKGDPAMRCVKCGVTIR